jgi:energy-coupling factor transporter ATP-binding protein EcfA2
MADDVKLNDGEGIPATQNSPTVSQLASPAANDPTVHVRKATFSDGTQLEFGANDIVVFVGPNNAGKSQALRDLRGLPGGRGFPSVVIKQLALSLQGSRQDVERYIAERGKRVENSSSYVYHINGAQVHSSWGHMWENGKHSDLQQLTSLFFHHLDVQSRLTAADTVGSFSRLSGYPSLPAHYLYLHPSREDDIAAAFKQAFGKGIVINRSAGSEIPILFGDRPTKQLGEEEHSESFQQKLSALPLISKQGDGMRCFAGILLNVIATPTNVLLVDEPEAFLHPPQARILGRFLAINQRPGTQLFLSTHSSDLLRGLLDANTGRVRVVRLSREIDINHVKQLDNADISKFWRDPLLRFSNILDGLFHDKVVVTEADGDCRFFSALADANAISTPGGLREPDVLFTPTFGKDRLLGIVKALRAIGVPTVAVTDFDFLNSAERVEAFYLALEGTDWARLQPLLNQVTQAVESRRRLLDATLLKPFIEGILNKTTGTTLDDKDAEEIRKRLKLESPWDEMKQLGVNGLPNGPVYTACVQLLTTLDAVGLFIVRKGELESFDPTIGKHGPAWVAGVMLKNLQSDPGLADARAFVRSIVDWKAP